MNFIRLCDELVINMEQVAAIELLNDAGAVEQFARRNEIDALDLGVKLDGPVAALRLSGGGSAFIDDPASIQVLEGWLNQHCSPAPG